MAECIFCRILRKEIPAEMVYEGSGVVAFKDIHPQAPVHVLIVPKKHVARLMDVCPGDADWMNEVCKAVQELARTFSVESNGFRVVVNNGPNAGQAVDHLHYHFLAGRKLGWPPG
jgi:histidine triad (HIT) family protein